MDRTRQFSPGDPAGEVGGDRPAAAIAHAGSAARDALRGRTILVAEDEALMAFALEDALAALGARVRGPYTSVGESLAAVRHEDIDLAYLDYGLVHERNVDPVAEALAVRGIPFLLVTGHAPDQLPPWAHRVPRLAKPVSPEAVIAGLGGLVRDMR